MILLATFWDLQVRHVSCIIIMFISRLNRWITTSSLWTFTFGGHILSYKLLGVVKISIWIFPGICLKAMIFSPRLVLTNTSNVKLQLEKLGLQRRWTLEGQGAPLNKRNRGLLSRNLTWNLKMMVSKRNLLFQGLLFRFHVKFQGCNEFNSRPY